MVSSGRAWGKIPYKYICCCSLWEWIFDWLIVTCIYHFGYMHTCTVWVNNGKEISHLKNKRSKGEVRNNKITLQSYFKLKFRLFHGKALNTFGITQRQLTNFTFPIKVFAHKTFDAILQFLTFLFKFQSLILEYPHFFTCVIHLIDIEIYQVVKKFISHAHWRDRGNALSGDWRKV